jgi:hypothetical protein
VVGSGIRDKVLSLEISLLGVVQQEQEGAKRLRRDRQHLACLGERELPLANPHVVEAETKDLLAINIHHPP